MSKITLFGLARKTGAANLHIEKIKGEGNGEQLRIGLACGRYAPLVIHGEAADIMQKMMEQLPAYLERIEAGTLPRAADKAPYHTPAATAAAPGAGKPAVPVKPPKPEPDSIQLSLF